eukprot:TRINITY_DN44638_c0_g1_i1.p1 TRINITY_DN44638_c0_g1~~TRINITY_DN44638_c0_g1_i1.p1  ORF type:complete len:700 (+),score=286.97 TRINITY_DN44638_c0_g1_i1:42-2102(+)
MAERRRELRESLRQKLAALEEKPAFLDVEQIAEKELPVALSHAKMLRKAADDPLAMTWKSGDSVPYFYLCDALAEVSTVSARLEVSTLMTRCFITLIEAAPAAVLPTVYLSLNKLAPAVEGIELGIGDAFLFKCIAAGGGLSEAQIREKYRQNGDLAEIAQHTKSKQTMLVAPKPLTLEQVYTTFKQVAQESGKDVQKRRMAWISKMMRSAKPIEANFIVRSLQGKMRLGLAEQTVLMSLAHAFLAVEVDIAPLSDAKVQWLLNSTADRLKQSFNEMPSFDRIIPELIKGGLCSLEKVTLTLNLPVKPMLAKPAKGVQLVLKRFSDGDFTCEYKYDGERAQIHCSRGKDGKRVVRIFSRNSENHTGKYPDVIQYFSDRPIIDGEVESFIIDSEVVAYDMVEKSIQPFQVLQHRARKEVKLEDVKVHVCIYAFDLLYLNGKSLLGETFTSRREKLHSSFAEIDGYFQFATGKDCTEEEDIETFLAESLKANCEGLMVKTLTRNSEYTPSRRTYNWLKLKKDYIDGAGDSVDLVPIGAWHGKGKRTGCYSAYLLACYDPESEGFQAICKVGTGFKDEDLTSLTTQLQDHTLSRPAPYYQVGSGDDPDVWFADTVVWEVKAADLSISPKHKAAIGIVDPAKGIALRFPRFIRTREDKSPQQATSSQQIAELYRSQFEGQEELQVADDDY